MHASAASLLLGECGCYFAPCKRNPRQSWILDSTPWIPDSRYWIRFPSLSVEIGFRNVPIAKRVLDFLRGIPDSKAHDSEFHKQNFPGARIPRAKSVFPDYLGRELTRLITVRLGLFILWLCRGNTFTGNPERTTTKELTRMRYRTLPLLSTPPPPTRKACSSRPIYL